MKKTIDSDNFSASKVILPTLVCKPFQILEGLLPDNDDIMTEKIYLIIHPPNFAII